MKLTQLYIVCIILNGSIFFTDHTFIFTDHTFIFTDGSEDGDKTAVNFICQSFEFSERYLTRRHFSAELEAIVSALRYIKITANNHKFIVLGVFALGVTLDS